MPDFTQGHTIVAGIDHYRNGIPSIYSEPKREGAQGESLWLVGACMTGRIDATRFVTQAEY